ncbi:hypothetical protein D3H65_13345 [Paraflavitalea soli]|uniref:Tetratricopeptide repeat protein n=1 Tax=Paraflavitalea soli TaxID=2315862 RepID=A0A3B7MKC1_9BACT|nr:hypothetical protein [Paraflavitalea soli]AXY74912.1 hypothetical protein D3H65_13345 [Paraflavitalea soli]
MQQHIHTIVKHFFQKDSLQEVPEQVLQQFTEDHPYSSVGHWLLAKKVHDTAPDRASAQSANAVAWFTNPLWLHWALQEHELVTETLLIPATHKEEPVVARVAEITEPAPPAPAEPEVVERMQETMAPEAIIDTLAPQVAVEEDDLLETEIMIPGVSEPVSLIEVAPAPVPEPEIETAPEANLEPAPEPEAIEASAPPEPIEAQATEAPAVPEPSPVSPVASLTGTFKPVISETEEPIFEPYHTIDYFASQGIKLRQEDFKDKLGLQLKSFTEWLRSMKRIAPIAIDPVANPFDESLQQSIQESAGHSVEGKEVLTEAMAEVWLKQGSKQKAIAIYEKLSLLNPAKSPYFVARIDQIKAL